MSCGETCVRRTTTISLLIYGKILSHRIGPGQARELKLNTRSNAIVGLIEYITNKGKDLEG